MRAITRVAAREWSKYGIAVNVICPFSESPGIEYMIENVPGYIDELTGQTAMKRLGSSERDGGVSERRGRQLYHRADDQCGWRDLDRAIRRPRTTW